MANCLSFLPDQVEISVTLEEEQASREFARSVATRAIKGLSHRFAEDGLFTCSRCQKYCRQATIERRDGLL